MGRDRVVAAVGTGEDRQGEGLGSRHAIPLDAVVRAVTADAVCQLHDGAPAGTR